MKMKHNLNTPARNEHNGTTMIYGGTAMQATMVICISGEYNV